MSTNETTNSGAESKSNSATAESTKPKEGDAETTSHFWVCSSQFLESSIILTGLPGADGRATFELLDCDGALVNKIELQYAAGRPETFELDQLMGGCKIESGMAHGHLFVSSSPGTSHYLRMQSRSQAVLVGESSVISSRRSGFFPVSFSPKKCSFLTLVNLTTSETTVKCRLFCGKRMPEAYLILPPLGSRVMLLATQFAEYIPQDETDLVPGYNRLTVGGEHSIAAQLIEKISRGQDGDVFTAVS